MTVNKSSFFSNDRQFYHEAHSHGASSSASPSFGYHFRSIQGAVSLPSVDMFLESIVPRDTVIPGNLHSISLQEAPGETQRLPSIRSFDTQLNLIDSAQAVAQPILNPVPVNFNPVSQSPYSTVYSNQNGGEMTRREASDGERINSLDQEGSDEDLLDQEFTLKREMQKKIQEFCGQPHFKQFIDNPKKYPCDFSMLSEEKKAVLVNLLLQGAEIKIKRREFDRALHYFALACQMDHTPLQEERGLMTFQTIMDALNSMWIRERYQGYQQIDISSSLRRMANCFKKLNKFSMAFQSFKLAYSFTRSAKDVGAWKYFLSFFERNSPQTENERVICLEMITEFERQNTLAWLKLGDLYKAREAFNKAIQAFETILKYDNPEHRKAHEELSRLYEILGDREKAAQHVHASKQKPLQFHFYQPKTN